MGRHSPSSLATLIDLNAQLSRDEAVNDRELRDRDRAIGRDLAIPVGRRAARLCGWLDRVQTGAAARPGHKADTARRLATMLLALIGLALGWASAMALFHYRGTHPVNVVNVLAFYVGLQAMLLVLTLLIALPLGKGVRDTLSVLSPGRLLLPVLERVIGQARAHQRVFARTQKWLVLAAAQAFAVAFNVGAIAGALQLIVFSDLAFGWSTTLATSDRAFHTVTETLAAPWAWFWSDARPGLDLVTQTRYDRAAGGVPDDPIFKQWWPFLLACIATYGLLPRVIALFIARQRLGVAIRHAMLHSPGAAQLLDRLGATVIESSAEAPERGLNAPNAAEAPLASAGRVAATVNWAAVPIDDAQLLRYGGAIVSHAGGARTLDEDRAAVVAVAEQLAGDQGAGVLVAVRAWEPPMMELLDFLEQLRGAIGDGRPVAVMPVAIDNGRVAAADPSHLHQWRRKLATLGDPWLRVSSPDAEAAP